MAIKFLFMIMALSSVQPVTDEQFETALVYEIGNDSIMPDPGKSSFLLLRAAEDGNMEAANYLGFKYYNGEGVTRNVDSALFWIRKAAESRNVKAAGNLGYLLAAAPDIKPDYDEAVKWLYFASEAGLPSAQSLLGDLKQKGLGCVADTMEAISLYEKAITAGLSDTQWKLVSMMAPSWEKLSGDSLTTMGLHYQDRGSFIVSASLFDMGASKDYPKAFTLLGEAYSRGEGVPYNHRLSMENYLKGALSGDPSAQFVIAELLDFFPDEFNEDSYKEIINSYKPQAMKDEWVSSPRFWYEQASAKGVSDSESAHTLLYSPTF